MKIVAASLMPFCLPLLQPLSTRPGTVALRRGLLLKLSDETGAVGYGEASPACWTGGEALEPVRKALEQVVGWIRRQPREESALLAASGAGAPVQESWDGGVLRWPSARCSLETALLDLRARRAARPLCQLLGSVARTRLDVAQLLPSGPLHETLELTTRAVACGFRTVKLKVGILAPAVEIERITRVREVLGSAVRLRIDANQSWSFETAKQVLRAVAGSEIELVEEPLRDAGSGTLARLRRTVAVPIAVDESVAGMEDLDPLIENQSCDFVVIKLQRLGGPSAALRLAESATASGLGIIVTDSIESAVGRAAAIHTAAVIRGMSRAIGLGGRGLLARDVDDRQPGQGGAYAEAGGPGLGVWPLAQE